MPSAVLRLCPPYTDGAGKDPKGEGGVAIAAAGRHLRAAIKWENEMAELPEPGSRMEGLMIELIKEQRETNKLLGDIKKRLPIWPTMEDFRDIVAAGGK